MGSFAFFFSVESLKFKNADHVRDDIFYKGISLNDL